MYSSAWDDITTEVVDLEKHKDVLLVTIPKTHFERWYEDGVEKTVLYLYRDVDDATL